MRGILLQTVPGTDTARDVGVIAAAALGVLAVLRMLWRGMTALVKAHEMVAEQESLLAQQRSIQARMIECLAQAKDQARDLDRVEDRLEQLEGRMMAALLAGYSIPRPGSTPPG